MADLKISALTDLPAADVADILPIVDIAPTPTTKKITVANLLAGVGGEGTGYGWVPLTDAANIASDNLGKPRSRHSVTLAGNRTLDAPSNPLDGAVATYRLKQDATGGRTITMGTNIITPSDITVTLSTGAGITDFLSLICIAGSPAKWIVIALTKGVSGL